MAGAAPAKGLAEARDARVQRARREPGREAGLSSWHASRAVSIRRASWIAEPWCAARFGCSIAADHARRIASMQRVPFWKTVAAIVILQAAPAAWARLALDAAGGFPQQSDVRQLPAPSTTPPHTTREPLLLMIKADIGRARASITLWVQRASRARATEEAHVVC